MLSKYKIFAEMRNYVESFIIFPPNFSNVTQPHSSKKAATRSAPQRDGKPLSQIVLPGAMMMHIGVERGQRFAHHEMWQRGRKGSTDDGKDEALNS